MSSGPDADGSGAANVETELDRELGTVGASREGLLQRLVFGATPEELGRRARSTVIMAKRDLGIGSRLSRWFRSDRSR